MKFVSGFPGVKEIGMRVAVISADMQTFMGYGVYLGDFHHPYLVELCAKRAEDDQDPEIRNLAQAIREGRTLVGLNPKLRLDNGQEVWGCECWWGPEDKFIANGHAAKYGAPVPDKDTGNRPSE